MESVFSDPTEPNVSDFSTVGEASLAAPDGNPITPRLIAMNQTESPLEGLQEQALNLAKQRLDNGEEETIRLQTASDRQQRQALALRNLAKVDPATQIMRPDALNDIDRAYNSVVSQNLQEQARTAVERAAIDKINDAMAEGDPVEAKLINKLYFGRGTALQVYHDEATKNLLLAQKVSQYEAENDQQGWFHKSVNMMLGFLPLNSNFANTGVVPGTESNFKTWLLSGTARQVQGAALWNDYTPEGLAEALKDGGVLDAALRSAGTTFGSFDPSTSADILKGIQAQSLSDKMWSNVWSVADPAFLVPWGRVASVPKMLARTGARKAATTVATDAVEQAIRVGGDEGARLTGVTADEAVSHLETTAMNPRASTPAAVPFVADVTARLERNREIMSAIGDIQQVSRATNVDELTAAIDDKVKQIRDKYGARVKDVKPMIEDIPTGRVSDYVKGSSLPEQGNSVARIRVTLGRRDGGGFASIKSALSEARNRLGVEGRTVGDVIETETKMTAQEAGFGTRAYHGTGRSFAEFDQAMAGSATAAENTRGGVLFFTDDPDVAHSYARKGASTDNHKEFNDAQAAFAADPSDANTDRYEAAMDRIMEDSGQNIRPVDMDTRNFYEADMKGKSYNGPETQAIIDHARKNGHDGVIFRNYDDDILGGKLSTTFAVFDTKKVRSAMEPPIVKRDVSGQVFVEADFHVPLDGFTTTPMNTPANGFFRFGRSAARRLDRDAQQKAVAAGASSAQLQASFAARTKAALKGLSGAEHGNLDAIMRAGQNKDVWLSPREMDIAWERLTGNPTAPDRVHRAYQAYQDINDADFFLRRNEIYRRDVNAGRENVNFKLGKTGITVDTSARVSTDAPSGRIFNASDHILHNRNNPLTPEDWERMKGEGYVSVTTKEPIEFPDGLHTNQIIVREKDMVRGPLDIEKGLRYKAGGHRAYTGKYYIKQAVGGVQPDTGSEFLKNPNVWRTGNNKNRLQDWATRWNQAVRDARAGVRDPQHFDDNIFANGEGLSFPSGEDFLKSVDSGAIDLKHEAEVVGDRELPSIYNSGRDDIDRFLDDAEGGDGGYYRSTGRMYTSSRGEALLDESGEFAETVDPWEMTDRAIANIARMSSFSNYKDNVLERFKATWANDLKLRQVENATPMELMTAEVRDHVQPAVARQILAEQRGFANIMNHETAFDKALRHQTREVAEWVLGDARGGVREMGHDFVYWLSKNNPVNFLRGLAFDAKLGMFNVGQFFLQASTMAVATALSPSHGLKGMFGAAPMFAFTMSKGSEAVLDTLAKNGVWKMASFADEKEFKDFARFMYKTGFLNVNSTHLNVNDLRPTRYFGAASKVDAVREMGRTAFYSAEIFNRSTAGRIAWEELKSAGVRPGSAEFREKFVGLADDYSMNMTSESSANFQKGLWSIPTQFWGYNVRMMDAMFGNRFTAAQKTRLILSQFLLYGAGGVAGADMIDEYVRNQSGASAEAGTFQGLISRGLLDNALAAISGADVRVGERLGSGTFLTDQIKASGAADFINAGANGLGIGEIFHVAEYNKLSLAELLGGATGSISGAGMKTVMDVIKFASVEGPTGEITQENLLKVADNISTFSNFHKAWLVDRYGIYKSQKGTVLGSDIPKNDALWFALGLGRPQEADTAEFQKAYLDRKEDVIKEAATQIRNWRQEAFSRPDLIDVNAQKQWTLLALYPEDAQQEIMKRTNKITDASFFAHVQSKFDQEANIEEKQQQEEMNGQPSPNAE